MVVINALVYEDRLNGLYVAEGYEMGQIGTGKTQEQAKKNLLDAYDALIELQKELGDLAILTTKHSERCIDGLQKLIESKTDIKPEIERLGNLEVHFYEESAIKEVCNK